MANTEEEDMFGEHEITSRHNNPWFFFFFFFRESDRSQQVDYSVAFEREVGIAQKNKPKQKTPYVAGLEALDTKVSMVVASTVLCGFIKFYRAVSKTLPPFVHAQPPSLGYTTYH